MNVPMVEDGLVFHSAVPGTDNAMNSPRSSLLSEPVRDHGHRHGRGPAAFRREREHHYASLDPQELIRRLVEHELEAERARRHLQMASHRADEAERIAKETLRQFRVADEKKAKSQREINSMRDDLTVQTFQVERAKQEIERQHQVLKLIQQQRDEADRLTAQARETARELHKNQLIERALEEGRRLGFKSGLRQAEEEAKYRRTKRRHKHRKHDRDLPPVDDDIFSLGFGPSLPRTVLDEVGSPRRGNEGSAVRDEMVGTSAMTAELRSSPHTSPPAERHDEERPRRKTSTRAFPSSASRLTRPITNPASTSLSELIMPITPPPVRHERMPESSPGTFLPPPSQMSSNPPQLAWMSNFQVEQEQSHSPLRDVDQRVHVSAHPPAVAPPPGNFSSASPAVPPAPPAWTIQPPSAASSVALPPGQANSATSLPGPPVVEVRYSPPPPPTRSHPRGAAKGSTRPGMPIARNTPAPFPYQTVTPEPPSHRNHSFRRRQKLPPQGAPPPPTVNVGAPAPPPPVIHMPQPTSAIRPEVAQMRTPEIQPYELEIPSATQLNDVAYQPLTRGHTVPPQTPPQHSHDRLHRRAVSEDPGPARNSGLQPPFVPPYPPSSENPSWYNPPQPRSASSKGPLLSRVARLFHRPRRSNSVNSNTSVDTYARSLQITPFELHEPVGPPPSSKLSILHRGQKRDGKNLSVIKETSVSDIESGYVDVQPVQSAARTQVQASTGFRPLLRRERSDSFTVIIEPPSQSQSETIPTTPDPSPGFLAPTIAQNSLSLPLRSPVANADRSSPHSQPPLGRLPPQAQSQVNGAPLPPQTSQMQPLNIQSPHVRPPRSVPPLSMQFSAGAPPPASAVRPPIYGAQPAAYAMGPHPSPHRGPFRSPNSQPAQLGSPVPPETLPFIPDPAAVVATSGTRGVSPLPVPPPNGPLQIPAPTLPLPVPPRTGPLPVPAPQASLPVPPPGAPSRGRALARQTPAPGPPSRSPGGGVHVPIPNGSSAIQPVNNARSGSSLTTREHQMLFRNQSGSIPTNAVYGYPQSGGSLRPSRPNLTAPSNVSLAKSNPAGQSTVTLNIRRVPSAGSMYSDYDPNTTLDPANWEKADAATLAKAKESVRSGGRYQSRSRSRGRSAANTSMTELSYASK
ncbi:hypothetical protein FISHEDRAFT_77442 [Fistulina hepatica ATCC 64428]|uniref:Uncharacterized protein n=1 Tax=Fistulina hepatica ATCC 64428 TaxID=1128425 RepID=A0A0D7A146_9AGAR|nr:hypothetical protein FISHEDRAFT_77442 [Fistulina hepatica ATCC 64428]